MRQLTITRIARIALVTAAALAVWSCGPTQGKGNGNGDGGVDPTGDGPNGQPHTLAAIQIDPGDEILELDLNSSASVGFVATAVYLDGVNEDVTTQATWSSANPAAGTLGATTGRLDVPGFPTATAVTSKITATWNGIAGQAQITLAAYRKSGPQTDFFFVLPYMPTTGAVKKPLTFATTVPALDVFFLMDTTGSMSGEINNLKSSVDVTTNKIAAVAATTNFGVGSFQDFPNGTNGAGGDQPFKLLQAITSNLTAVHNGVNALALGDGVDGPEAGIEAIYQAATGAGITVGSANVPAQSIGFHTTSMPVIVPISDAPWHMGIVQGNDYDFSGAHNYTDLETVLHGMCGHVVGIAAGGGSVSDMTELSTSTGSRVPPVAWDSVPPRPCSAGKCCTGLNSGDANPDAQGLCPLVFSATTGGSGVSDGVVTGIQMLARFATFDVTTKTSGYIGDVNGAPLPVPHNTLEFITAITPASYMKPATPAGLPDPTFDATAFHNVTPSTKVNFDVSALNTFVPQTANAQIFRATIQVLAGGCTPLDQRDVLILVPPAPLEISKTH